MPEGNYHVKYAIVYIIKQSLKANELRDVNITVAVQRNRFPRLVGGPGWPGRHVC